MSNILPLSGQNIAFLILCSRRLPLSGPSGKYRALLKYILRHILRYILASLIVFRHPYCTPLEA
jgi:hypothetical protein